MDTGREQHTHMDRDNHSKDWGRPQDIHILPSAGPDDLAEAAVVNPGYIARGREAGTIEASGLY